MSNGSFRFRPTGKRVLVKLEELPDRVGRFVVVREQGHNAERAQCGRLMVKGTTSKCVAEVGNRVVVNPYNGKDCVVDGIPFKIFDDFAVLAVVTESDKA